ncbi:glycosyltransferase family 2 protein [Thermococcus sp.]
MTTIFYPRVSIIILNWNGWGDTVECLESVYRIDYPNYDVIVVDNGSKDDSVEKIKEYASGKIKVSSKFFDYNPENKPIKVFELREDDAKHGIFPKPLYEKIDVDRRLILIKNKENLGYTGGNNVGMKFALSVLNPEYILLLNNDTVVAPDFLKILLRAGKDGEDPMILGPRIMYYSNPNETQFLGAKYYMRPFFKRTFNSLPSGMEEQKIPTDEVHGAAMMIERDVLIMVGLLDDDYFAYWDETDFCLRARGEGGRLYTVPFSRVWHKMGSRRKKRRISPLAAYLFGRNMVYLLYKNFEGMNRLISLISVILLFAPRMMFSYTFYRRDFRAFWMFVRGLFDGFLSRNSKKPAWI